MSATSPPPLLLLLLVLLLVCCVASNEEPMIEVYTTCIEKGNGAAPVDLLPEADCACGLFEGHHGQEICYSFKALNGTYATFTTYMLPAPCDSATQTNSFPYLRGGACDTFNPTPDYTGPGYVYRARSNRRPTYLHLPLILGVAIGCVLFGLLGVALFVHNRRRSLSTPAASAPDKAALMIAGAGPSAMPSAPEEAEIDAPPPTYQVATSDDQAEKQAF